MDWQTVDWSNPQAKISNHFTVHEATWLPSWGVHHAPTDEEKKAICAMAAKMDVVREFVSAPISIHCWIRPGVANCTGPHNGEDYNAHVGGARNSGHKYGKAVDWDCGESCDIVRGKLEGKLELWELRMERMPGGTWVHLDCMPVPPGGHRYFMP